MTGSGASAGTARGALRVLGLSLLLALGCEDVVVEPVEVRSIEVLPSDTSVSIGEAVQLGVRLLDGSGGELSGRAVLWSSEDTAVAAVDASGMVVGRRSGDTRIHAAVDGVDGMGRVVVRSPPAIVLDPTSASFTAAAGALDIPSVEGQVLNGGEEPLEGLTATIEWAESDPRWLIVSLAGSVAPAALTLSVRADGLAPGEYATTVRIDAPGASNSPVRLPVSFEVRASPPAGPTALAATPVAGPAVELGWTDNSGDELDFRIERADGASGAFAEVGRVNADVVVYRDETVETDAAYQYRVRACSDAGCSGPSNAATATTPPVTPTGLVAAVELTRVQLTWTDGSRTATGFRVQRRRADDPFALLATVPAGVTGYLDTGLPRDATFEYRVAACNDGGCSAYSAPVSATTPPVVVPAAPSGLAATVRSATAVDLAWTDNAGDETRFSVERRTGGGAFAVVADLGADVTGYRDEGVTADRSYTYRVRACGPEACSPYSNEAGATTPPTAPSDLLPNTVSATSIQMGWTDNSATETGFEVERKTGAGDFARIATVAADNTSYVDGGLTHSTLYVYRVRACNDGGCSAYTPEVPVETLKPPPPADPSGFTAEGLSSTSIRLGWTDNSSDELRFEIERRQGTAAFAPVASAGANITAWTDDGLTPSTTYDYRVRACHDTGCSGYATATGTTLDPPPPGAPVDLAATATRKDRVAVSWTDTSDDEVGFVLERWAPGESGFSLRAEIDANVESYEDRIGSEGTYTYRIQACGTHECSAFSNEASALSFPAKPSGPTATALSPSEIELTWKDESEIEAGFEIERKPEGGSFSRIATVGEDLTRFTDSGLAPDNKYEYRIRACNASGCSDYSPKVSATTDPPPPTAPDPPTDLVALDITPDRVELRWSDNSDNEVEFRIERKGFLLFTEVGRVGENVNTFTDLSVISGRTYEYRVLACNHQGCSDPSNVLTITTPDD